MCPFEQGNAKHTGHGVSSAKKGEERFKGLGWLSAVESWWLNEGGNRLYGCAQWPSLCMRFPCMHLWISLSIAVSAALTPVRIDKLCGRTNSEVAGKTHRSAHLPLLPPPPPLWLTSLFVGYIRWKGGGFVFCSVRQNTHVYSSARFDVLSPRNDRLGLAERKIGSVGREREGESVRWELDPRFGSSVLVVISRSLLRFWISMLDSNLIGIWLTNNNDLLLFFF